GYYVLLLFFSGDPPTTEIYTLSLHDALPISQSNAATQEIRPRRVQIDRFEIPRADGAHLIRPQPLAPRDRVQYRRLRGFELGLRSEEHTSELQSRFDLVCRLLLEKKKKYSQPLLCSRLELDRHARRLTLPFDRERRLTEPVDPISE